MAKMDSLGCEITKNNDDQMQRRSANYKPNIWNYDSLASVCNSYDEEKHKRRVEELKEYVKCMLYHEVMITDQLITILELIDNISKLGLANLFEEEIRQALDHATASTKIVENSSAEHCLYATALRFRLLRQHGYEVSQEVFRNFMENEDKSKLMMNGKGMLEIFEASHLSFEGEDILDEANGFLKENLKYLVSNLNVDDLYLDKRVGHALDLPSHWRVQWFDVRWQINAYEEDKVNMNPKLLELAKLNFNMVQSVLQHDLLDISRWWANLGLKENMTFVRDRLVESFMCAIGLAYECHCTSFRKWLTKVTCMILVIDDVYDLYGTLEELHLFTNAVDWWDARKTRQLPKCMNVCFEALNTITVEIANEIHEENGRNQFVLLHLKKVWAEFCKALYVEAKWYNEGYTPSLQEYLSNAWITSSGPVLLLHVYFASMHQVEEESSFDFLQHYHDFVYNISLIIRLCNDLGTSTAELERGDAPSSILCHMREGNVTEEIARKYIEDMIKQSWKKINKESLLNMTGNLPITTSLLKKSSFVNMSTNAARVAQFLYQHGDGFGVQDKETRTEVVSLLVHPLE